MCEDTPMGVPAGNVKNKTILPISHHGNSTLRCPIVADRGRAILRALARLGISIERVRAAWNIFTPNDSFAGEGSALSKRCATLTCDVGVHCPRVD